jgi:LmbE family N-acetylglucosaminyl deacetylase
MMRTLILEPHFDDTAYSMAGLLLTGVVGAGALVVTVFSRSIFAPYAAVSGVDEISALRYREHKKFCAGISVMYRTLGYDEAPQRGWSMDNIFDTMYGKDDEMELKKRIAGDFVLLNESYMPDEVFAPLGISGHIDHVAVRECAEKAFPGKIKYYEDLPYAGEIQAVEYTKWIENLTKGLQPIQNPDADNLDRRIELLKSYRSQVAEKDIKAVRNYISMHRGERFWTKLNRHG